MNEAIAKLIAAIKRSEDMAKVEELIALGDSLQWSDELTTAGRLVVNALPALRRLCGSVPTEQPQIALMERD